MYNIAHDFAHDWLNKERIKNSIYSTPRNIIENLTSHIKPFNGGGGNEYSLNNLTKYDRNIINIEIKSTRLQTYKQFEERDYISTLVCNREIIFEFKKLIQSRSANSRNTLLDEFDELNFKINNYFDFFIYYNDVILDPFDIIDNRTSYEKIQIKYKNNFIVTFDFSVGINQIMIQNDIIGIQPIIFQSLTTINDMDNTDYIDDIEVSKKRKRINNDKEVLKKRKIDKETEKLITNMASYVNFLNNMSYKYLSDEEIRLIYFKRKIDYIIINGQRLNDYVYNTFVSIYSNIDSLFNNTFINQTNTLINNLLQAYRNIFKIDLETKYFEQLGKIIYEIYKIKFFNDLESIDITQQLYYICKYLLKNNRDKNIINFYNGIYKEVINDIDIGIPYILYFIINNSNENFRYKNTNKSIDEHIKYLIQPIFRESFLDISGFINQLYDFSNKIIQYTASSPIFENIKKIDYDISLNNLLNNNTIIGNLIGNLILNILSIEDEKIKNQFINNLYEKSLQNEKLNDIKKSFITTLINVINKRDIEYEDYSIQKDNIQNEIYEGHSEHHDDTSMIGGGNRFSSRLKIKKEESIKIQELEKSVIDTEDLLCNGMLRILLNTPIDTSNEKDIINNYLNKCEINVIEQKGIKLRNKYSFVGAINSIVNINLLEDNELSNFFIQTLSYKKYYFNNVNINNFNNNIKVITDIVNNLKNIDMSNTNPKLTIQKLLNEENKIKNIFKKTTNLNNNQKSILNRIILIEQRVSDVVKTLNLLLLLIIKDGDFMYALNETKEEIITLLNNYILILQNSINSFDVREGNLTTNEIIMYKYITTIIILSLLKEIEFSSKESYDSILNKTDDTFEEELLMKQKSILEKLCGGDDYEISNIIPLNFDKTLMNFFYDSLSRFENYTLLSGTTNNVKDTFIKYLLKSNPGYEIINLNESFLNQLYYINNAVTNNNANLPKYFCPISSVIDGQPTCQNLNRHPFEKGNIGVNIHDDNNSIQIITEYTEPKYVINYSLKINNTIIEDTIIIDNINNSIELNAVTNIQKSFFEVYEIIKNIRKTENKSMYQIILEKINTNDNEGRMIRHKLIKIMWKKIMGDFLQEINVIVKNSGYINEVEKSVNVLDRNIFRLGLANDRPSAIRMITLILFAKSGITDNVIAGFLNNDGKYLIASKKSYTSGGGVSSRRRKKIKPKRKTLKKQKQMKTRTIKKKRKKTIKRIYKIKNIKRKKNEKKCKCKCKCKCNIKSKRKIKK